MGEHGFVRISTFDLNLNPAQSYSSPQMIREGSVSSSILPTLSTTVTMMAPSIFSRRYTNTEHTGLSTENTYNETRTTIID